MSHTDRISKLLHLKLRFMFA